ncbi:MAG: hypothetical protein HY291_24005 [Planctomycetes bacterium]|nr:hypothetical protein [Planctomycetota bacterium]
MASTEWSERTRLLITVGAVVLVNVGVWGLAYTARDTWVLEEAKLKKLSNEVHVLQQAVDRKEELTATLNQNKRTYEKKEKMLPEITERDKFIEFLADLAQKKNLTIKGTPPNYDRPVEGILGIQDPQNFRRDIWGFSGTADFKGICEYMNVLEEHYPRFVSLEGLSITTSNSGMNVTGTKHEVSFSIMTYRYVGEK